MDPTDGKKLLSTIVGGLVRAATTDRGRSVVAGHDEDYEVSVGGEGAALVRMRAGRLDVLDVAEGKPAFCAYTRVEFDPAAVPALLNGAVTPTDAADSGGMLMRSRLYGGGQFMGLLRIAQREGLLAG